MMIVNTNQISIIQSVNNEGRESDCARLKHCNSRAQDLQRASAAI